MEYLLQVYLTAPGLFLEHKCTCPSSKRRLAHQYWLLYAKTLCLYGPPASIFDVHPSLNICLCFSLKIYQNEKIRPLVVITVVQDIRCSFFVYILFLCTQYFCYNRFLVTISVWCGYKIEVGTARCHNGQIDWIPSRLKHQRHNRRTLHDTQRHSGKHWINRAHPILLLVWRQLNSIISVGNTVENIYCCGPPSVSI